VTRARLRPLSLQLGDEETLLGRALDRLDELDPGDVALLPELLAWTPLASETAYATLLTNAVSLGVSVITTLNLSADLAEDLPGRAADQRYNALVVFTRHGDVHVPQAKVTPQSFEMDASLTDGPGIGVARYGRINRVCLDLGEELVEARFFVCSDLWALGRLPRDSLRANLWIVPANFARGAEAWAARLLDGARAAGLAGGTALVNPSHVPRDPGREPLTLAVESLDEAVPAPAVWPPPDLDDAFRLYDDGRARNFVEMARLAEREGRIAVPRSLAAAPLVAGEYPVTIAL
jgi:hypothetical protein